MEPSQDIHFRSHGAPAVVKTEPVHTEGPPPQVPNPSTSLLQTALQHAKLAAEQAITLLAQEATLGALGGQFESQLVSLIGKATLFKSSNEFEQQIRQAKSLQVVLSQPPQQPALPLQVEMSVGGISSVAKHMKDRAKATGGKAKEVQLREASQGARQSTLSLLQQAQIEEFFACADDIRRCDPVVSGMYRKVRKCVVQTPPLVGQYGLCACVRIKKGELMPYCSTIGTAGELPQMLLSIPAVIDFRRYTLDDVKTPDGESVVMVGNKNCPAAFINDPRGTQEEINCKFIIVKDPFGWPHVFVTATRDIESDEALWMDYGKGYFTAETAKITHLDTTLQKLSATLSAVLLHAEGLSEAIPVVVGEHPEAPEPICSMQGFETDVGAKWLCKGIHCLVNRIEGVGINTRKNEETDTQLVWQSTNSNCRAIQFDPSPPLGGRLLKHFAIEDSHRDIFSLGEMQPELVELQHFIQKRRPSLIEHFVLGFVHIVELMPGTTARAPHNSVSLGDQLVTFTTADVSLHLEAKDPEQLSFSANIKAGGFYSISQNALRSQPNDFHVHRNADEKHRSYLVTFCFFFQDFVTMLSDNETCDLSSGDIVIALEAHHPSVHPARVLGVQPNGACCVEFLPSIYARDGWLPREALPRSVIRKASTGWFINDGTLRGQASSIAWQWHNQARGGAPAQFVKPKPFLPLTTPPFGSAHEQPAAASVTAKRKTAKARSRVTRPPGQTFVDGDGSLVYVCREDETIVEIALRYKLPAPSVLEANQAWYMPDCRFDSQLKGGSQILLLNPAPIAELEQSEIPWKAHGNEWIGRRVHMAKYNMNGSIVAFVPEDIDNGDIALYHVVFDDNEIEDLEQHEVVEATHAWDVRQNSVEPPDLPVVQPDLIGGDAEAERVLTCMLPEHVTTKSQQQSCVSEDVYKFTALALANQFTDDFMPDWLLMDAEEYFKGTSFGARKRFFTENVVRIKQLRMNPGDRDRVLIAHAQQAFMEQPRKKRKLESTYKSSTPDAPLDDMSVFGHEGRNVIVWFRDAAPPRYVPGELLKHDHHHYNVKWADGGSISRVQLNMPEPGFLGHKENIGNTALQFRFVDPSVLIDGVSFDRLWGCCHNKFHE